MTTQRPNAPTNRTRRKVTSAGSRGLNAAITTTALPAVILSSVTLAQPAAAAPATQVAPTTHRVSGPALGAGVAVPARATVPAALVASLVPTQRVAVPARTVPSEYTVKAGDTIGAIAARHGLPTDDVLSLNGLDARTLIHPGQRIRLTGSPAPADKPAPSEPTPASTPAPSGTTYVVKPGDTLGAIASRHDVSLQSVLSTNELTMTSIIHPGQKLTIGEESAEPAPTAPAPTAAPAPAPSDAYTVEPGDTLGAIASRNGVSLQTLLTSNDLSMTSIIRPGQKLTLTGPVTTQNAPATPVPVAASGPADLVPSTFLGYTYPERVVADANANKALLDSLPAPSRAEMKQIVADTARSMGVDPSLALAFAFQESGFNQRAVSPANAIGTMQVIPSSGQWASDLVGRELNLLDPYDNATAGVAIIRSLIRTSPSQDIAIASYYQGAYSVGTRGMFEDTKQYVAAITAHQGTFR